MTLDSRLATVVDAARSKKAFRIRLVDVKEIASFTDVMAFMSGGSDRQNRAIAEALVLTERTVTTHVSNILGKLELSSRTQIAAWAIERGLNPPSSGPSHT